MPKNRTLPSPFERFKLTLKEDGRVMFPCVMEGGGDVFWHYSQGASHVTHCRITAERPVPDDGWKLAYLNDGFKVWFRFVGKSIR